jgi:hypothetical protein
MNRYEKELKAIGEAKFTHATAIKDLYDLEAKEDRKLTEDERLEVEGHMKAIRVLEGEETDAKANLKTVEEVEDIGRKLGPSVSSFQGGVTSEPQDRVFQQIQGAFGQKSPGEMFTESVSYKSALNRWRETGGGRFSTGAIGDRGDRPAGHPGRRRQAVPAAHVRGPDPLGPGDDERDPVRRGRHRDLGRRGRRRGRHQAGVHSRSDDDGRDDQEDRDAPAGVGGDA